MASPRAGNQCRGRCARSRRRHHNCGPDFSALGAKADSFGVITAFDVIEHVIDPRAFLGACRSALATQRHPHCCHRQRALVAVESAWLPQSLLHFPGARVIPDSRSGYGYCARRRVGQSESCDITDGLPHPSRARARDVLANLLFAIAPQDNPAIARRWLGQTAWTARTDIRHCGRLPAITCSHAEGFNMSARRLARNSVSSVLQVVVSTIISFALYRFLASHLSISEIGIWSLVLATTASGRLGDLGVGGGVVKFVANDLAQKNRSERGGHRRAWAWHVVGILGRNPLPGSVSAAVARPGSSDPRAAAAAARASRCCRLRYCPCGCPCREDLTMSALDGCQRTDIRALITIAGSCVQFVFAYMLVPVVGLRGVAIAQVAQSLAVWAWGCLPSRISFESRCDRGFEQSLAPAAIAGVWRRHPGGHRRATVVRSGC